MGIESIGVSDVIVMNQTAKVSDLDRVKRAGKSAQSADQIDETSKEFEAVFLSQMLEHMFQDVDLDPMSDNGTSDDIYKSMLVDEFGKILARTGGIGVADHVKREMLKLQEV